MHGFAGKVIRRAGVPLCCGATALVALGCGGGTTPSEPGAGGDLKIALESPVPSLDQFETTANEGIWAAQQITQPLVDVKADGSVVPVVASSYEVSGDNLVWTFKLRREIRFSNGTPVRPADVKFTLQQSQKRPTWGFLLSNVSGITASASTNSVAIRIKKPTPSLPAALALYANGIIPNDYAGKTKAAFFRAPIGTGPFMVEEFKPGASLTLGRNPHYWEPKLPYLDTVEMTGIADPNSRTAQLRGGEQDVIASPPWSQVESLTDNPSTRIVTSALARVESFFLNAGAPPLNDIALRQAFSLALNRAAMAQTTLSGLGAPAGSYLAPSVPGLADRTPAGAQDIEAARQLVERSSYRGQVITIKYNGSDSMSAQLVQIAQQNLAAAGIKTELEGIDYGALSADRAASQYEVAMSYMTSDIMDPSELVGIYMGTKGIATNVPTAELSEQFETASTTADPTTRAARYGQVVKGIDGQFGVVPVQYAPYVYATGAGVQGFEVASTGALSLGVTQVGDR